MERYICIHNHFYQPPRENPWLEEIELQTSAFPFHDWNERITDECYRQNAHSRILDTKGRVKDIIDNYARTSFNVGPTLLNWMREKTPEVYRDIVQADVKSQERFSGHGSAMAQVYNHLILPLANPADKYTQVYWGIRDFERHFNRKPEGMWLPETAVNVDSLEVLAELGIAFTVLAPHQAKRIRPLDKSGDWTDVEGARIDPTRCYRAALPSGRSIDLFFYDGPISRSVAFDGVLGNGERFARKLMGAFHDERQWPQMVHIATDGETYGHHHRYGDMALAYALSYIEKHEGVSLTNYGEFREKHPAQWEVEIVDNTSWSCVHGLERWYRNCGCNSGRPGWHQEWREPMRNALDWLRDNTARLYEETARELLKDPWDARNRYIEVIKDRTDDEVERFFGEHGTRQLTEKEQVTVLKLLELQRHSMLMYTSCGWFFDELSGLETVQCLQYAGRVIQLGESVFKQPLEEEFLARLEKAQSNLPEYGNGRGVYQKAVRPTIVDFKHVAAHYAISTVFHPREKESFVFAYEVTEKERCFREMGKTRMLIGSATVRSTITRAHGNVEFAVVHFGGHNVHAGVRYTADPAAYNTMVTKAVKTFEGGNLADLIRLLDKEFGTTAYSILSLFRDQQSVVLQDVMQTVLERVENSFIALYSEHTPIMRFLADSGNPLPPVYRSIAEFVRNRDMLKCLATEQPSLDTVRNILREAGDFNLTLDPVRVPLKYQQTLNRLMKEWHSHPEDLSLLEYIADYLCLEPRLPESVDHWKAQNLYLELARRTERGRAVAVANDDRNRFRELFRLVGQRLGMRVDR